LWNIIPQNNGETWMTNNSQRSLVRWIALWMVALGLGLMLTALPGCGGGGGAPVDGGGGVPPPVADGALRAAQPGELAAYFKDRLQERAEQGYNAPAHLDFSAAPPQAAGTSGGGVLFAGAPQQEQGVDEDDLLKTDGTMLYTVQPSYANGTETVPARLSAQRRQADGSLVARGTSTLPQDFRPQGMYLASAASRIAVLAQKPAYDVFIAAGTPNASTMLPYPDLPYERKLAIDLFSTADGGRPAQTSRIEIDGSLVGSRMIGNVLYVVSQWTPDTSRYQLPAKPTREQADAVLANLDAGELLPTIRIDGAAAQPLVTEADCLLQPANASLGLQLTTITAFDLSTGAPARRSRCFVGGVESLYMSPTHVYLASSRQYWIAATPAAMVFPPAVRTDIHKFSLQGLQVDYRASGDVAGHLGWDPEKKPYRMSEHNGDLRVLSFTGESGWSGGTIDAAVAPPKPASPATLTILREDTAERALKTVATLPNAQRPAPLGHAGEQVYGVHFAGPTGYLVTFRRTDPLYVLDLSNPADPRQVGELEMPGYSDYLFPLAGGKLLGVGKDANAQGIVGGIKVALFDVADQAQPRVLASRTLGGSGAFSALDYSRHGISLATDGAKVHVALPVRIPVGTRSSDQGLARYLVDTSAGTLDEQPFTLSTRFDGTSVDGSQYARFDLANERSVRIATDTYYLTGGALTRVP
jgi:hypothetical protein